MGSDDSAYAFVLVLIGFILGIVIGLVMGDISGTEHWKKEAVKHGAASYSPDTGRWHWNDEKE